MAMRSRLRAAFPVAILSVIAAASAPRALAGAADQAELQRLGPRLAGAERPGSSEFSLARVVEGSPASAQLRFGSSPASRAHKGAAPGGSGSRSSRSL
jgi:hypothetical protein